MIMSSMAETWNTFKGGDACFHIIKPLTKSQLRQKLTHKKKYKNIKIKKKMYCIGS